MPRGGTRRSRSCAKVFPHRLHRRRTPGRWPSATSSSRRRPLPRHPARRLFSNAFDDDGGRTSSGCTATCGGPTLIIRCTESGAPPVLDQELAGLCEANPPSRVAHLALTHLAPAWDALEEVAAVIGDYFSRTPTGTDVPGLSSALARRRRPGEGEGGAVEGGVEGLVFGRLRAEVGEAARQLGDRHAQVEAGEVGAGAPVGPAPKVMWRLRSRSEAEGVGVGNSSASRLADAHDSRTFSPARPGQPPTSVSWRRSGRWRGTGPRGAAAPPPPGSPARAAPATARGWRARGRTAA